MKYKRVDPINLFWTTDKDFKTRVNEIRQEHSVGPSRFPPDFKGMMEFDIVRNVLWNNEKKESFSYDVISVLSDFNLGGWDNELEYFIGTGTIPEKAPITPPQIMETEEGLHVGFTIHKPIEKTNLQEWLEQNWLTGAKLGKIIKNYFYERNFLKEKSIKKSFNVIKRIIELKQKDKKSFSEIATIINNETELDIEAKINEESVKQLYHEYMKYPETVKKRLPNLPEIK